MFKMLRWAVVTASLSGAVLPASSSTAWAQKGGSGGGGGSTGGGGSSTGGGGGGGGTSTNPLKGVNSYTVAVAGGALNPAATGVATVSFNSLGTYRALVVQLDDIDLPDGSIVAVTFYDDGKFTTPTTYYGPFLISGHPLQEPIRRSTYKRHAGPSKNSPRCSPNSPH